MLILHDFLSDLIDLQEDSHYYAAMQIIRITILTALVLLASCSNRESALEPNLEPKNGTVSNSAVIKPNSEPLESTTDNTSTASSSSSASSSSTAADNQTAAVEIDVLERIRRGFQFPRLESKYTSDYIKWSTNHATYLTDLFARAEPFLYYIVEEIDKRGLPMELALLPAIESAYKPNALSRSKASGLWQFIPSTGKSFGLRQDWWYDGRRDFLDSTNAALDYLSQLNTLFKGDWHLTLAAYNAGQGTVLRAIGRNKRSGKKTNYQALSLRTETVKYVPKLQALVSIVKDPSRYGVSLPKIPNRPYFEILALPGQVDLQEFSKLANIDLQTLKHMNAGHLRWATSPDGPHRLLTPLSNHVQSSLALQQIEVNPSITYHQHSIAQGETLSQIARRYGVSVSALQNTNKLSSTRIRAGKTLIIPVAGTTDPQFSQTNQSSGNKHIHTVVKGDTLWSISKRYNVELQKLINWNQLAKNHILQLNQSLLIFLN